MAETTVPCVRSPRQARGRRRIDEILDAAEALVAEVGMAQASVQEIARRAGASVGSMYHFFPTKDAILAALADRYAERLHDVAGCVSAAARERADAPLCEFVAGLVDPFADFIARNPGYLVLTRGEGSAGTRVPVGTGDAAGRELHDAVALALALRFPGTSPDEAAFRASMVKALGEGVLALMARSRAPERERLMGEFRRALGAYLTGFERSSQQAGIA